MAKDNKVDKLLKRAYFLFLFVLVFFNRFCGENNEKKNIILGKFHVKIYAVYIIIIVSNV